MFRDRKIGISNIEDALGLDCSTFQVMGCSLLKHTVLKDPRGEGYYQDILTFDGENFFLMTNNPDHYILKQDFIRYFEFYSEKIMWKSAINTSNVTEEILDKSFKETLITGTSEVKLKNTKKEEPSYIDFFCAKLGEDILRESVEFFIRTSPAGRYSKPPKVLIKKPWGNYVVSDEGFFIPPNREVVEDEPLYLQSVGRQKREDSNGLNPTVMIFDEFIGEPIDRMSMDELSKLFSKKQKKKMKKIIKKIKKSL